MRAPTDTGVRSSCWPTEPQEHTPDGPPRPGRAELVDFGVLFEATDEIGLPWHIRTTSSPCASVRLSPKPPSRPSSLLVLRSPTTRGRARPCAATTPTGSLMSACTLPHRGQRLGGAAPAGHHRLPQPAPALGTHAHGLAGAREAPGAVVGGRWEPLSASRRCLFSACFCGARRRRCQALTPQAEVLGSGCGRTPHLHRVAHINARSGSVKGAGFGSPGRGA